MPGASTVPAWHSTSGQAMLWFDKRLMFASNITDAPKRAARSAGLRYVNPAESGLGRVKSGAGFRYVGSNHRTISGQKVIRRIQKLAIPPAWKDVWICRDSRGHLQATGRDSRGRKQYIYHPKWSDARDEDKFQRMLEFGRA